MEKHKEERLYQLVGELISKRRKKLKYTQKDLAEMVDLTRTSIVNIEKGRHRVSLHVLFSIATALKVKPTDLIPSLSQTETMSSPEEKLKEHMKHIHDRPDLDPAEKDSVATFIKQVDKS